MFSKINKILIIVLFLLLIILIFYKRENYYGNMILNCDNNLGCEKCTGTNQVNCNFSNDGINYFVYQGYMDCNQCSKLGKYWQYNLL